MDFYRAFEEFVDLALKAKPDLVLHTGDLFDSVRPSNRALTLALEQLLRFSEAEIPVVLIAGNHSTPKLRETGSVFRLFEHLKGIYPIYKGEYERLDIGEATVHALPHCEPEAMIKELAKFVPTKKEYNLGMLHAGVSSLRMFRMGEFNESIVPSSMLRTDLDYFALGHYHNYSDVTKNAFYAGSTERLSFAEAGESKGFVLIDLAKRKQEFKTLHIPADDRPAPDRRSRAGRGQPPLGDLRSAAIDRPGGQAGPHAGEERSRQPLQIDRLPLAAVAYLSALHFEPKLELLPENASVQSSGSSIDSLEKEWVSFLESHPLERVEQGTHPRARTSLPSGGGRIRLRYLELRNYRKFRSSAIEFPDGVIGILGQNGVGKSTLVEAVAWALYGNEKMIVRTGKESIRNASAGANEDTAVNLVFEIAGDEYKLYRAMRGRSNAVDASLTVNGQLKASGEKAVTQAVERLLGMDYKAFFISVFARQKELNALSVLNPADRKKLVLRMLGVDRLDEVVGAIDRDLNAVKAELETLQRDLVTPEGARAAANWRGRASASSKRQPEASAKEAEALQTQLDGDRMGRSPKPGRSVIGWRRRTGSIATSRPRRCDRKRSSRRSMRRSARRRKLAVLAQVQGTGAGQPGAGGKPVRGTDEGEGRPGAGH